MMSRCMAGARRIALPALAWLWAILPCPPARAAAPAVSALVRVQPLRRGTLSSRIQALGRVTAASERTRAISFARPVRVLRVEVRPGEVVRRGQPLLLVAGVAGSDAAYLQARHAVRYAKSALRRLRQLQAQQLATRSQLDAAEKALADARARLAAARAQGLGAGAQRATAPFDAVVDSLAALPGAQLAAGAAALTLAPRDGLQAVVGVPPAQALRLRVGGAASLRPVFGGHAVAATILAVAGRIDPASGRVAVTLAIAPRSPRLLPGEAVQADLPLQSWNGWVIPRQAVLRDPRGQSFVFQDAQGKARRIEVTVEAGEGERSVVSGALDPAWPLVVLGNYELRDGMALRVQRGAAAAAAAAAR